MTAASFVDSNVLLCADDIHSPAKRERAESLIKQVTDTRSGFARQRVEEYAGLRVVVLEPADLLDAIDLHRQHQFSIWDALIIQAALISHCDTLYSEDLQHGRRIDGLEIVNPFR